MSMRKARAAYAAAHMNVREVLNDSGAVIGRRSVRKEDAPSFRQWVRDMAKRGARPTSPKLERIARGAA